MTVVSETKKDQYNCDGEQVVFPYTFFILSQTHIKVILCDSDGTETVLTIAAPEQYTVSGVGNPEGGNVTTIATYDEGYTLTIVRSIPVTQLTDYIENDIFPANSHERALDKLTMIVQELTEKVSRAIKLAISSSLLNVELPVEAGQVIGWNEEGDELVTYLLESMVNAEIILALLKTVDGAGSGLDADLLDGLEAAVFFLVANHTKAVHDALGLSHDSLADVSVDDHHAQAHTLASHSTKAHAELTDVTANQHHAQAHTLASHSTKPHSALTDVSADQHHAQSHKDRHDPEDGADKLDTAGASWILGAQSPGVGAGHSFARHDHTHGIGQAITQDRLVTIDDAAAAINKYCRFTAIGIQGRTVIQLRADIGVEEGATADLTGEEIVALLEALAALDRLSHTGGLSDVGANDHHNESHGLGGGTHAVTTLAGINAKITDADLDDHEDPRPPTAHTLASHSTKPHSALTDVTANQHHAESHTLASHSTKPHSALTDVTSDQHHAQSHNAASHSDIASTGAQIDDAVTKKHVESHTLASHSTKPHSALTDVTIDQHHARDHAGTHVTGGADVVANAVPAGNAGLMTGADKTKLNGIAAGANVVAAANMVDHTMVRGNGGAKGVQDTGIAIDDNDVMTLPASSGIVCPEKLVIPLNEPTSLVNGCIWIV